MWYCLGHLFDRDSIEFWDNDIYILGSSWNIGLCDNSFYTS
jgi:hypothetical protein